MARTADRNEQTLATDEPTPGESVGQPADLTGLQMLRDQYAQAGSKLHAEAAILRAVEISFERSYPLGTSVVLNRTTFEFVSAPTRTIALKAFIARFGKSASGWAFEVGRPMTVGGGTCPN